MSRYIVFPVGGDPNKARIYDIQKKRYIKSDSGNDTFLKVIAEAKAKRLNADFIGRSAK